MTYIKDDDLYGQLRRFASARSKSNARYESIARRYEAQAIELQALADAHHRLRDAVRALKAPTLTDHNATRIVSYRVLNRQIDKILEEDES